MKARVSIWVVLLLFALCALPGIAGAADWKPTKPITVIVPWPAGGATDLTVRILASEMEKVLGQRLSVVNTPGASGAIGMQNAYDAPKDGYTWTGNADVSIVNYPVLDLMKMANPSIRDIDIIGVGQELKLPEVQGVAMLQQPDNRFALLLLSTPSEGKAREIGKALRKHGFDARVGKANFGGGRQVWRVVISDLDSRATAQSVGEQLQRVVREDTRIAQMAE